MKSYLKKILCVIVLIVLIQSQVTIPSPDPSWDDYKVKSCCPLGFIEVDSYCLQCNPPNVYDSIDRKCKPCPSDHSYNNVTKSCDCKVAVTCSAPRVLNSNNVCECPADQKGIRRVYNQAAKTCDCPANLPLWNGKYCVACPTGTQYDSKERQCYHCPEGFKRDYNTHACVPSL